MKFCAGQIVRELEVLGILWTHPTHLWMVGQDGFGTPVSEKTEDFPSDDNFKPFQESNTAIFEPIDPLLEAVIRANLNLKEQTK